MLKSIKALLVNILNYFGYTITKSIYSQPVDLRMINNNPKALGYYTRTDKQVLIEVDFINGRGLEKYSLASNSKHPFIVATKAAISSDDYQKALKTTLTGYYDLVQPLTASSWLGFDEGEVEALDNQPPWLTLLPWENTSLEQKNQGRASCASQDSEEHGSKLNINKGWRDFGPVSEEVLDLEVKRLHSLILSIEENGILRDDSEGGDIGAVVLMNENSDYRWLVEWGGQHRAAVISAMGYKNTTIRVWQVIERKDVELWPNVVSGVYSKESALKIFDRIFTGISTSKVTQSWEDHETN